jgi:ribosomal protein S17
MKTHKLKTWPGYFDAMLKREKMFEVRKNDRNFKVGDTLKLMEWNPDTKKYTGSHIIRAVTFILDNNNPFIDLGDNIIMSIQ